MNWGSGKHIGNSQIVEQTFSTIGGYASCTVNQSPLTQEMFMLIVTDALNELHTRAMIKIKTTTRHNINTFENIHFIPFYSFWSLFRWLKKSMLWNASLKNVDWSPNCLQTVVWSPTGFQNNVFKMLTSTDCQLVDDWSPTGSRPVAE